MGRSNAQKLVDDVIKKSEAADRRDRKLQKVRKDEREQRDKIEPVTVDDGPPKLPSIGTANRDPVQLQINIFCGYFFLACWWNFRHKKADLPYSDDDPNAANLLLVVFLCVFLCVRKLASDAINGSFALLCTTLIVQLGCVRHFEQHRSYAHDHIYMQGMWKYTVLINLIGAGICLYYSIRLLSSLKVHTVLFAIGVAVVLPSTMIVSELTTSSPLPACATVSSFMPPAGLQPIPTTSRYVPMDDGTRLAADVYLPNDHSEGKQYPTIVQPTRYGRSSTIRWPFNKFQIFHSKDTLHASVHLGAITTELVHHGYAVVVLDVRGTGASFGPRLEDLHPRETKDYPQIVAWVKQQPWCNAASVGTSGFLFDGAASAVMASRGGIAASALLFPTLDTYGFLLPGGIPSTQAVEGHSWLTRASTGTPPQPHPRTSASPFLSTAWWGEQVMSHALGGAVPVEGWEYEVENAITAHKDTDVTVPLARKQAAGDLLFTDDVFLVGKSKNLTIAGLGLAAKTVAGLQTNSVQVFTVAGYSAGRTASEGANLHLAIGAEQSRLLLGPWGVGATTCYENGLGAPVTPLLLAREVRAFFDSVLQSGTGSDDSIASQTHAVNAVPVGVTKYYVTGGGGWKHTQSWPPPITSAYTLHLTASGDLGVYETSGDNVSVDVAAGVSRSGTQSRWNIARSMMGLPVEYATDGAGGQNRSTVVFVSPVLDTPLTVIGAPVVSLRVEPTDGVHKDIAIFVYLEEQLPGPNSGGTPRGNADEGVVQYVSEGQTRASLATSEADPSAPIGHPDVFQRPYTCSSQRALHVPTTVAVAMETVAHTFAVGSRVRLSIAGADVDNFDVRNLAVSATWRVHIGNTSFLSLPAHLP